MVYAKSYGMDWSNTWCHQASSVKHWRYSSGSSASRLGNCDRAVVEWFLAGPLQPTNHLPAYPHSHVGPSPSDTRVATPASTGLQPFSRSPATRAVRISRGRVDATQLSLVLSHALGMPIFITAVDHRRGLEFAAVPEAKCAEIFMGESVLHRECVVAPEKSVTVVWQSATTNEPFAVATQKALTTPPSQRQPHPPEKSTNKRHFRQPASKANKKSRGEQDTTPSAAAPASGAPSTQPASLPAPPQLPTLEASACAGLTRGRDVPRHAMGHLAPAMTGEPSAPTHSAAPPLALRRVVYTLQARAQWTHLPKVFARLDALSAEPVR